MRPQRLHQTVSVAVLLDDEDRVKAAQCLQECKETILDPFFANRKEKLKLKLSGIEILNDDPTAVNVLFAKIEDSEELQDLCNQIMEKFVKHELSSRERDHVKLHITLINTRYQAMEMPENQGKTRFPRITFDARKILEKFKDFYFGTIELTEFHLSTRHTEAENGFYEASAIIKI